MTAPTTYATCVIYTGRQTLALPTIARHTDPNEAHAYAAHLARTEHIVAVFEGSQRARPLSVWVFGHECIDVAALTRRLAA